MNTPRTLALLVVVFGVAVAAIAEEITLSTYYPSPRGVYEQIRTTSDTFLAHQAGQVAIGTSAPLSAANLEIYESAANVSGAFTMHGVKRVITIPVQVLGFTKHQMFGERAGFSASFTLNRSEYGIDWNLPMEAGSLVLGNDVRVEINMEAYKPKVEEKKTAKEPSQAR